MHSRCAEDELLTPTLYCIFELLCVCMCSMHMPQPTDSEEGIETSGTGVTGSCELFCGFQELNISRLHSSGAVSTHNHGAPVPHFRGIKLG